MLTSRQKETIEHIKNFGIETPEDIIKYCLMKLQQPYSTSYTKHLNAVRKPRRRHSRKYYYQIIDFYK